MKWGFPFLLMKCTFSIIDLCESLIIWFEHWKRSLGIATYLSDVLSWMYSVKEVLLFNCVKVYWKTTHTNQYLSLASHHPVTHKVAVVRILMSRANTLSSSGVQRVEEKIVDALKENGYPSRFIRKPSCPTRHRQEVDVRERKMW